MSKVLIDIDDEALIAAQKVFGTKTKKDTVNRALTEATARIERADAWARLQQAVADGAVDDDIFEEKSQYRARPHVP